MWLSLEEGERQGQEPFLGLGLKTQGTLPRTLPTLLKLVHGCAPDPAWSWRRTPRCRDGTAARGQELGPWNYAGSMQAWNAILLQEQEYL